MSLEGIVYLQRLFDSCTCVPTISEQISFLKIINEERLQEGKCAYSFKTLQQNLRRQCPFSISAVDRIHEFYSGYGRLPNEQEEVMILNDLNRDSALLLIH
jgi:hypothetical protein